MNKKTLYSIIISLLLSISIVFVLVAYYKKNQPQSSGFTRLLKPDILSPIDKFDLGYNSFYLAGITSQHFYLGNFIATSRLLRIKHNFEDTTFFKLKLPPDTKLDWERVIVRVDSSTVYMMEGTTPVMFYARLPSPQMKKIDLNKTFFTESIPLSCNSAILKVFDRGLEQYVLTKKIVGIPYNTPKSSILEKQVEGRFSVDGLLQFELETSTLVYLYYYRNQFISLDTALNIIYKGNTIDTVTKAQINVAHLKSESSYTMSSPSLLVNKRFCLTPNFIFIQSARKADNEDQESFNQSAVIDVYGIKNGDYRFSFYLPNLKKGKLRSFMIYGDRLVTIFEQYLCTYRLKSLSEII